MNNANLLLRNKALTNILENTKRELKSKKTFGSFSINLLKSKNIGIIAEIKLASPTEKSLGSETEILKRAIEYEKAGIEAISFITEKSIFKGNIKFIPQIKSKVKLPVLQKDFVIDPYQIYQAKIAGSDAFLLIAKILTKKKLIEFVKICLEIGLEPVVEINDSGDLKKTLATETRIIAVNARNLDTLQIDIEKAVDLLKKIPGKYLKLGFSGVTSKIEVEKYRSAGVKGVLVGTNLMKTKNIKEFLKGLR